MKIGFRNAPVTKFIVPIVSGCSALAVLYNAKPHLATQLSHFTEHNQVKTEKKMLEGMVLIGFCLSFGDYLPLTGLSVVLERQLLERG